MDSLPTGSIYSWLIVAAIAISPIVALFGFDVVGITSMRSVRIWAAVSTIAALILLSPVVAFLMVIAAEVLMEAGMTGVSAIVIGAFGCVLFRRILRAEIALQSGSKEVFEAPPLAAPPW